MEERRIEKRFIYGNRKGERVEVEGGITNRIEGKEEERRVGDCWSNQDEGTFEVITGRTVGTGRLYVATGCSHSRPSIPPLITIETIAIIIVIGTSTTGQSTQLTTQSEEVTIR